MFISTKYTSYLLPEKENRGIGSIIEDKIVSLVHNTPGISQKEITQGIEKSGMASHNTVINQIKKMVKDGVICERHISGRKNIEYFTPDYMDANIEEQLKTSFESLYKMFQDVEKESETFDHQLKRQVNERIEDLLFKIPEEINYWVNHFKSQRVSELSIIHEDTKNMMKLLDDSYQKKILNLKKYRLLSNVICKMRGELCMLDAQCVKLTAQRQNARLSSKRKVIDDKLCSVEYDLNRHYTELYKLDSRIRVENLDDAYVENLVKVYLDKNPDVVQKICTMLNERNIQVRSKLEEPLQKICSERSFSIQEEKLLHSELEAVKDKDVYDDKKEKIRGQQAKTQECEKIIDTIYRHLESGTSINDILAEIPEEYRQTK